MHIQVLRGPFLSTLAQIQGVIEAKRTLPILSHLLLEAKENAISISGTDLDVSIQTTLDGDVKNEGRVAVSGKKLYEIARELPDTSIDLRWRFITLEDETGLSNAILTPDIVKRFRVPMHQASLLEVAGPLQRVDGVIHVRVRELLPLDLAESKLPASHDYR